MDEKLKDSYKLLGKLGRLRTIIIIMGRIGRTAGQNSHALKRKIGSMRFGARMVRNGTREKFNEREQFLVNKHGRINDVGVAESNELDQSRYGEACIFNDEYEWVPAN